MSAEGIKPMASLDAGLLGRRTPARRVPLSFAPVEAEIPEAEIPGESDNVELGAEFGAGGLPEVMRQVERLALALGVGLTVAAPEPVQASAIPRRRVAFTLRLDPERHGQLRQIAGAQGRSAQLVLVEAFDRYRASFAFTPILSATPSSPCQLPTGNQP